MKAGCWIGIVILGCGGAEGEGESEAESEAAGGESESESESEGEAPLAAFTQAVVLTASPDAQSGAFSVVDLETLTVRKNLGPASGDAVGRAWFGQYYVVNRFGSDSIQVHDPKNDFSLVKEFSVGSTSDNAQDMCCVASDRCYVTRLQARDVLVVDPTREDEQTGAIDLASLAEDGIPNAGACQVGAGGVFVALGMLDDADPFLTAYGPAFIATLDPKKDALTATVATQSYNPFGPFVVEPAGTTALIGEVGAWGLLDGGFARIDLSQGKDMGIVVSEKALGGDVGRIAVCESGEAFSATAVCDENFDCNSEFRSVDLASGTMGDVLYTTPGFSLTWLVADDRGRIWLAERQVDGSPTGIWIYDCDGTRVADEPLNVGEPPAYEGAIVFL